MLTDDVSIYIFRKLGYVLKIFFLSLFQVFWFLFVVVVVGLLVKIGAKKSVSLINRHGN